VLDISIVVDPPGIVVVLGTCDAVGVIEAEVVTVKTIEKHNENYIFKIDCMVPSMSSKVKEVKRDGHIIQESIL
jgi:hypothetical protein